MSAVVAGADTLLCVTDTIAAIISISTGDGRANAMSIRRLTIWPPAPMVPVQVPPACTTTTKEPCSVFIPQIVLPVPPQI